MSWSMTETLVLLHGFGATGRGWDAVRAQLARAETYRPLTPDLPGHGSAHDVRPITFASCVDHVLARVPGSFTLAGYSMGGRIALHIALSQPELTRRLVLVSTTAGIDDAVQRAQRREADEAQAQALEHLRYEEWIRRWDAQPLFVGDPEGVKRAASEDQRRNRPAALAAAMRGIGTGQMEPLWDRLGELAMPVTVLVGERDARFRSLGERLAAAIPGAELQVVAGGHRLALESPAEVARTLTGV